jgi:cobalt/nickel transport system ATP-binding protein
VRKAVEIKNLSFTYPDGNQALHDVTLDVYEGEAVGLVGPNGAGKSTLLIHLNGLLNGDGNIRIFEKQMSKENLAFIRQKVGLVFQDPEDQLFMPTVYEDVAFGPKNFGLTRQEIEQRVEAALQEVDLTEKKEHLSYHLSLGEKKRAAIATVLSMMPQIIVLDEPNANLDPRTRRHLIDLLGKLELTKIIASHDLEMVLKLCNRVVLLDKGKIVAQGETREILSEKYLLESHGLEVPLSLLLNN